MAFDPSLLTKDDWLEIVRCQARTVQILAKATPDVKWDDWLAEQVLNVLGPSHPDKPLVMSMLSTGAAPEGFDPATILTLIQVVQSIIGMFRKK